MNPDDDNATPKNPILPTTVNIVNDPENELSTHLDVVQNFRLRLQDMPREERAALLDLLKTPNGDCTLRQELEEWKGLLYWEGFLRDLKPWE